MNLPDGRRGLPPPNPRRRAYPGEHPVTPSCSVGYKWSLCVNDYQCLLRIDRVIACNHRWHRLAYSLSRVTTHTCPNNLGVNRVIACNHQLYSLAYSLSEVTNGPAPPAQVISASIG